MKRVLLVGLPVLCALLASGLTAAQEPAALQTRQDSPPRSGPPPTSVDDGPPPVPLEWTPPALAQLSTEAAVKSSFTLDRSLLGAAAGMVPEDEPDTRRAIRKLDGVSVHLLRFGHEGMVDEPLVDSIRDAYHLRGWKHLVTTTSAGGPVHSGTTDVWLVLDGVNIRGAVVMAETPRSLTLVTVAGNVSPVDILHLRGHFGIPRFDGDRLRDARHN